MEEKAGRAAIKKLAVSFVERATELGYKGKKRDGAALDYFVGAASWEQAKGDEAMANWLGRIAWLISVRGYGEVEVLAKQEQEAA